MTSQDVAFNLLLSGILDIRTLSESVGTEDDLRTINVLAHLIHNWPAWLWEASGDHDFDQVLRRMWQERDPRSDPWMAERLAFFGVDYLHLEDVGGE